MIVFVQEFAPIFAATFVIAMATFLAVSGHSHADIIKVRLKKAARPSDTNRSPSSDIPSIIRERNSFLKKHAAHISNASIRSIVDEFESLLRLSGLSRSALFISLTLVLGFSFTLTFFLSPVFKMGALLIFFVSLIASVLIFLKILLYLKARTLDKFQQVFPEALDLIVRSVRAGLPVSEAIKVISEEVSSPVSDAFHEVASHLSIGMTLEESLTLLQKNVPLAEVKFFAISLSIQQETGGNLAEILANSAAIMRKRAQLSKKIKAFSSEARASALIIGSLPFVVGGVLYLLNREYLEVLFFDQIGQLFLIAAISSIGVGAFIIAKMIRFEV